MLIEISKIHIASDRPTADPDSVQTLAESIAEIGLINPITVDKENNLIAGLHRLQAANLLGWSEIECTVRDFTDLQAELAEIDENIIRRNLGTMDRGEKLLRRKEIYEALHPESKNGGDRRSENFRTKTFRSGSAKSFVQDTAEKLGVTPRTVEMQIPLLKNTWHGDPNSLLAAMISGMALFLKTYGAEISDKGFVDRFRSVDPLEIGRKAKTDFSTNKNSLRYAKALWKRYNTAKHGGRKLPYRLEG